MIICLRYRSVQASYVWAVGSSPIWGGMPNISATECNLKGTVSQDFRLLVFFMNLFPLAPEYTIRAISNFRKYAEIFTAQDAPLVSLTLVANGKNLQS
jgi:hypothetical protein